MTAPVAEERAERTARPVVLTVDDDPSVSRAVARDLRRRYGADYRIMRSDSGEEALQAIKDVVLRGEQVAAILADYRMPRMNGVDFLEQAMDLVPQARRALLTAYADTNAAITGALAGARFGADAIPQRWLEPLHQRERVSGLAMRLLRA